MPDITVNFLASPQDSANSTSECRLSRPPVQYLPMPSANTSAASVFKKGSIFAGLSEQEFGLLAVRMVQRRRVDLLQRRTVHRTLRRSSRRWRTRTGAVRPTAQAGRSPSCRYSMASTIWRHRPSPIAAFRFLARRILSPYACSIRRSRSQYCPRSEGAFGRRSALSRSYPSPLCAIGWQTCSVVIPHLSKLEAELEAPQLTASRVL